jgi:hypothetical protein
MKKREIFPLVPPDAPLPVCDMETFPLAKLSLEKGIPFLPHALKLRKSSGRASASLARAIDALLRIM